MSSTINVSGTEATSPVFGVESPCVVMLHSSMSSSRQWNLLAQMLQPGYRVIAVDLYGYGDNAMPEVRGGFSLSHEVANVLDALGKVQPPVVDFHLVGHSYGGAVALRLAHSMQARIRSLSLYEPTAFHLLPADHAALTSVKEVAAAVLNSTSPGASDKDRLKAAEIFIDFWNGEGSFSAMSERQKQGMIMSLPKAGLDFGALCCDPLRADDYRELAIQTCVMSGSTSPNCVHQIVAVLADALPMRQLRWVPAGHMAPITHPQLLNPMIAAFIASCEIEPLQMSRLDDAALRALLQLTDDDDCEIAETLR